MSSPNFITLQQLNTYLQDMLAEVFAMPFWVVAEIAEYKQAPSGHLYMELVDKSGSDTLTAKAQAVVWHNKGLELRQKFGADLPNLLKKGNKVLVKILLEYHPVYGLKLVVQDLDASVTMGELELRRRQTLERLQREGLSKLNAQLPLPTVLQRVAVVSSPTAAGYGDFINHLQYNSLGYKVQCTLFQSAMQGDAMQSEMSAQLKAIANRPADFDVVVIIRGGGSKLDLETYNDYLLSAAVAQMPLPVLTGIGHQQDESVIDLMAHTALKTPTAVAEFILQTFYQYETALLSCAEQVRRNVRDKLQAQHYYLRECQTALQTLLRQALQKQQYKLEKFEDSLRRNTQQQLNRQNLLLDRLEQNIALYDSNRLLKRGFVWVRKNGIALTNSRQVCPGDHLEIVFAENTIKVTVWQ